MSEGWRFHAIDPDDNGIEGLGERKSVWTILFKMVLLQYSIFKQQCYVDM